MLSFQAQDGLQQSQYLVVVPIPDCPLTWDTAIAAIPKAITFKAKHDCWFSDYDNVDDKLD